MNRDTPARAQERAAWQSYMEAVRSDLRTGRSIMIVPPASTATLAAGAAWFKAYRERELHEGRAR